MAEMVSGQFEKYIIKTDSLTALRKNTHKRTHIFIGSALLFLPQFHLVALGCEPFQEGAAKSREP